MVCPQKNRMVAFDPDISYFKPRGIPLIDLEEMQITIDEYEALRLSDLMDMSYEEARARSACPVKCEAYFSGANPKELSIVLYPIQFSKRLNFWRKYGTKGRLLQVISIN